MNSIAYEPIASEPIAYELNVSDRNYTNYCFKNTHTLKETIPDSNPLFKKWFHKDVIDAFGNLIKSPYMDRDGIPGVLIVNGNTYGRDVKAKLLYKCIPDDKSLPVFLIPYEYNCTTFSKSKCNKYIMFRIKEWINKHPIGILTNTIGDVNNDEAFYQYQLWCKNIHHSISGFTKATVTALKRDTSHVKLPSEDRRTYTIFSIDPPGSKDIDDAIGITYGENKVIVSIYIANVAVVLDHLHLWDAFGKRVSTIYLPNGKMPMLPTILSDDLCSLVQSEDRCAYCMDICIEEDNTLTVTFKGVRIRVMQNYTYEEASLLNNPAYIRILNISKQLNRTFNYVEVVADSHHVVEFFMIMMNYEASLLLLERKSGIFRITTSSEKQVVIPALPKHMTALVNTISGTYCTYENTREHVLIGEGLASYAHVTSPIRRLVDLCNLIELQEEYMSDNAKEFLKKWMTSIDDINTIMKNIKKVQHHCNLLSLYAKEGPQNYTGILFNMRLYKEDMLKYSIYLPTLNMVSTLKTREKLDNYSTVVVSTHAFVNEDTIMKKIRFQLNI